MVEKSVDSVQKPPPSDFVHFGERGNAVVVKGVSRQVVEVLNTGNVYFNKALLFVSPEKSDAGAEKIREEADHFVETYVRKKGRIRGLLRAPFRKSLLQVGVGILIGAAGAVFFLH